MKPDDRGLSAFELTIGRVLRIGIGASSILLAAGLLLTLSTGRTVLHASC